MCRYLWMNSLVRLIYILGCWQPLPRSNPPILNLLSCRFPQTKAFVWWVGMLSTMLTRVKIKTLIFHVANLITVLQSQNPNWCGWRWTLIDESSTLKLDRLGEVMNVNCHFLVIYKTSFVLVVADLFPWSDDGLGRNKQNFYMHIFIFIFFHF